MLRIEKMQYLNSIGIFFSSMKWCRISAPVLESHQDFCFILISFEVESMWFGVSFDCRNEWL